MALNVKTIHPLEHPIDVTPKPGEGPLNLATEDDFMNNYLSQKDEPAPERFLPSKEEVKKKIDVI